jgi:peptidoglycan-associated lipoprotein
MNVRYYNYACICVVFLISMYSCVTPNNVKDGKTAFDLKRYNTAIDLLKKEYAKSTKREEKSGKSFLIATCYDKLCDYNRAIEWYSFAEKADYGLSATLKKAYALKKLMKYNEASVVFESLENIVSISAEVRQQKLLCKSLFLERNNVSKDVVVEKFLSDSYYSDYNPVNYDNDFLVITSDRDEATGSKKYEWTGNKYSDLFIIDKESKDVKRFDTAINSEYNDGTPTFNKNFTQMVFTRCYNEAQDKNDNCKLMIASRVDGLWSSPAILSFIKEDQNYGQPCFIENDSVLVFSSKLPDASNFDLYYAEFDGINFSEPVLLPGTINSEYNEFFPTKDNDTLYFSSDIVTGMGGYDIYKTWLSNDGVWHSAVRLPFPINSGADDFSYTIDRTIPRTKNIAHIAYFTSSRANDGRDAIYEYKIFKPQIEQPSDESIKQKDLFDIYLALKVVTPRYLNNQPSEEKIGKKNLAGAFISIWSNGKKVLEGDTDKNGLLLTQLNNETDYEIKVSKDSFLNNQIIISTKGTSLSEGEKTITINKEVELDRIYKGQEIVLQNIYYDYDKWAIKPEAEPTLNALAVVLTNNPQISIELGSHTDCRGDDTYNEVLSQKRAQSAIDYLISKGIDASRMTAKGYGETIPAVQCICESCTEDQHQKNRRTSFKIL